MKKMPPTRQALFLASQFILVLALGLCAALPLRAQQEESITTKKITVEFINEPLKTALERVELLSGFRLAYPSDIIETTKMVSLPNANRTVEETLNLILHNTGIDFKQDGRSIVLFKAKRATPYTTIQKLTLKGIVRDDTNAPLSDATVLVKGTQQYTTTGTDGTFSLPNVSPDATLSVSFIGYKTIEYNVNGLSSADITLVSNAQVLEDVVVTGYQTIAKERATGAYAIVGMKELDKKITIDATAALEGQIAGVNTYGDQIVIRGTSTFLSDAKPLVVIDGLPTERDINNVNMNDVESFTVLKDAAAAAIYGVRASNGVIVITTKKGKEGKTQVQFTADWKWVENPSLDEYHYASTSQIMDFELAVLSKRVRQSTLANGNELVYLNDYIKGIGEATNNSITYASPLYNLRHALAKGSITQDQYNQQMAALRSNDYRQEYIDNAWTTPFRQSYNLSISNANERQNTYASLNYIGNQLQLKPENNRTIKGYLKTTQKVTNWLKVDFGMDMQYTSATSIGNANYRSFTNLEPYTDLVNENGRVYRDYVNLSNPLGAQSLNVNTKVLEQIAGIKEFQSYQFNTLDELDRNHQTSNGLNLRSFVALNFQLYKGLTFKSSFDYEYGVNSTEYLIEPDAYVMRTLRNQFVVYNSSTQKIENNAIPAGAYFRQTESKAANYVFRNQADYRTTIAEKHDLSFAAGIEIKENYTPKNMYQSYFGFNESTLAHTAIDEQTIVNTGYWSYIYNDARSAAEPKGSRVKLSTGAFGSPKLTEVTNRFVSFYAAGGYTYNNRYNFTGSVRLDQTNLFGSDPKYRYRPLWSIGAKWNADKEEFMQGISWLDMLDVRASYGLTGNVDQTSSPYLLATSSSQAFYTVGETIAYTSVPTAPNTFLRWEKTTSYGLGVDFSVLNRLLSGKIDLYYKYSDDLLTNIDTDYTTGFSFAKVNNGAMSNKGIEVSLSSTWFKTKDWALTSSAIFSYNKNTVERSDYAPKKAQDLVGAGAYRVVGNPMYSLYAYRYKGLTTGGTNDQNGVPIIVDANGNPQHQMNADGTVSVLGNDLTPADVYYMGSLVPTWNGSFNQGVKYKSWELTAMLTFYGGNKVRKPSYNFSSTVINGGLSEYIASSWRPDNIRSTIPKTAVYYENIANLGGLSEKWQYSDANVVDGDMIRLRNVALSYNLPRKYCQKVWMEGAKVTAQANNLWFWSAAGNDFDPETQTRNEVTVLNPKSPATFLLRLDITF